MPNYSFYHFKGKNVFEILFQSAIYPFYICRFLISKYFYAIFKNLDIHKNIYLHIRTGVTNFYVDFLVIKKVWLSVDEMSMDCQFT